MIVRMCRWPGVTEYDTRMVAETLRAWARGAQPTETLHATVVLTTRMLYPDVYGLYEPASKTIYINVPDHPAPLNIHFYYTLAHELTHAIFDQRHVPWDKQHCIMFTGPVLAPARALLKEWAPDTVFEDPVKVSVACGGREAEE